MQCSCGGETREHKITENYKTVMVYDQCESCGRNNYRQRLAQTENSGKLFTCTVSEQRDLF